MEPCPHPRLRLILAHLEYTAGSLRLCPDAPPGNERAGEGGISEIDRDGIVEHAARPEGVMAQP